MTIRNGATRLLLIALLLLTGNVAVQGAVADDWPQWRGPNRDALSGFEGLRTSWPDTGPPELWRAGLAGGFSGIAVAGGRAITMTGGAGDRLVAFDIADGDALWDARIDDAYRNGQGNGPRSTPTVVGDRVFALSAQGILTAHHVDTGTRIWARNLRDDFGASPPTWGFSTSPLVHGDRLLVEVGGRAGAGIVAFDIADGAEIWRSQGDRAGYSAPIVLELAGTRTAVFFTGERIVGVVPDDGRMLWAAPWTTSYGVNAATPVAVGGDAVFISSGYDVGSAVYRVADGAIEPVWRNREMKNQFSSSLFYEGYLYGFDNSVLECIDATTGERMWRTRGFGHGSLLYADGHLVILGDGGDLALAEATPAAYREVARTRPFTARTWTMPSLADGILYVRSERELVALDLRDPARTEPRTLPLPRSQASEESR